MNLRYEIATIDDLEILTATRIEVLRAANKLDPSTDMSLVEKESYSYYKQALPERTHIAVLVYDDDNYNDDKCNNNKSNHSKCYNGKFVGAGGISFYKVMPTYHNPTGKKAYIMNMYTRPEYRRKGIAYHTLDLLISEAKKMGVTHILLEATDMGKPLYEKYGFVKMKDEMELFNSSFSHKNILF